jgi:hypothetical protein
MSIFPDGCRRGEKIGITGENAIEADWLAVAESLHG